VAGVPYRFHRTAVLRSVAVVRRWVVGAAAAPRLSTSRLGESSPWTPIAASLPGAIGAATAVRTDQVEIVNTAAAVSAMALRRDLLRIFERAFLDRVAMKQGTTQRIATPKLPAPPVEKVATLVLKNAFAMRTHRRSMLAG
jgi:hypothetical protein